MEIKPQIRPPVLDEYEALLACLPVTHSEYPRIHQCYYQQHAGYQGEKMLPYYLQFLPENCLILYQLRLQNIRNYYFQMDAVVVTPYMILILEVKNYKGKLRIEPHYSQLIQKTEHGEKVYPCPLQQSRRQEQQLRSWLTSHGFPSIPIYSHICIANDYSHISSDEPIPNLSHITKLPEVFTQLSSENKRRRLTDKKCLALAEEMVRAHEEGRSDLMQKYQLTPADLQFEVQCAHCPQHFLKKARGGWICETCQYRDEKAHVKLFRMYARFVSSEITMKQASMLLGIEGRNTVRRLVKPYVQKAGGSTKASTYCFINERLT
ncbi:nuclease-related domain-containing protein [Alkalicoccus halolimnae]|uniref:Nuclease-related domain-containing protein n=1 Tax=Alkalicoccus halolimnae TaxID=1667239 RepID=A0A5C7F846_9BACI|nr:nuclease-related domain-containing protein [Alkalicoccus halolimnae]TXF85548.1 NERD domain-containing protein [Alkalicoccus halolimnae]